jgi:hypothetical protein
VLLELLLIAGVCQAAEFHAAPEGIAKGNGSQAQPWDLATALAAVDAIAPGDTLWVHAGKYRGGFVSQLRGTPDRPIVVRAAPGARVTIDTLPRDERDNGLLVLKGADVRYRDFEVTCSHPQRTTTIAGSWPADIRRGSVDIRGDRISAINLVVHDCASGFGFWSEGEGGEISGCVIFNNGWRGPDRGHGHAIYAQNAKGTKRIVDNILFHQFAYGIHVYGSDKSSLKGFEIDGNIAFENGCLTRVGDNAPGIMVGGGSPAERIALRDNLIVGGSIRLGYPWGTTNEDVVCTGNYADQGLVIRDFRRAKVENNTFVAHSSVVRLEGAERLLLQGHQWRDNRFFITNGQWGDFAITEGDKGRGLSFDEWKGAYGLTEASTFTKGAPVELRVIIRPNSHEKGRANIAVLNPAGLPDVEVDLSKVLAKGQTFRIVSAKDFFGRAIVQGKYAGQAIRLPMQPITPPQPVGMPAAKVPVTEPQFAAFVVLSET